MAEHYREEDTTSPPPEAGRPDGAGQGPPPLLAQERGARLFFYNFKRKNIPYKVFDCGDGMAYIIPQVTI